MGVYIKGMEMPKNCDECDFVQRGISDWCYIAEEDIPCNCPLIEVPPHGRLIDADELLNAIKKAWEDDSEIADVYKEDYAAVSDWLYTAPTVIPADKDGET